MKCSFLLGISIAVLFSAGWIGEQVVLHGAEPEPQSPGASIDGFRFEFPCRDPMPENPRRGADCFSGIVTGDPKKTDNFTVQKEFGCTKNKARLESKNKPYLRSISLSPVRTYRQASPVWRVLVIRNGNFIFRTGNFHRV